jgi:hypothetical protein
MPMWRWCMGAVLVTLMAQAAESLPLQIAFWPPVQVVCPDSDVRGLKLNLPYGDNQLVQGLDVGLVSGSELFGGIQVNLGNWVRDLATGLQVGLANTNGAQEGLSIGLMNRVDTRLTGMQIGLLNQAEEAGGMQVGLINTADSMVGIQIGLVNVMRDCRVPCMPVLLWQF